TARFATATHVSVCRSALSVTVPGTAPPGPVTCTAAAVTVSGSTGPLNRATTCVFSATPVLPVGGLTVTTATGVLCGPLPVVKLQLVASTCPTRSVGGERIPVYAVSSCSAPVGISVTLCPSAASITVADTGTPVFWGYT